MTPIYQILVDIQKTQSFERLEAFKDPQTWVTMTDEERHLLSNLFLAHGVQQLSEKAPQVLESFDFALKASIFSPLISYQQGLAFALYSDHLSCLHLACQSFAQAIEKDSQFLDAWYMWGKTLCQLGILDHQSTYFIESEQKFAQVEQLLNQGVQSSEVDYATLYWMWGRSWAFLGKDSGEPIEYYQAILKYRLASELGCQQTDFLSDYSRALVDFAALVDAHPLLLEALQFLDQAIQQDASKEENWLLRAYCLSRLYEVTGEEELAEAAIKNFSYIAELNSEDAMMWLKWGQLEALMGKLKHDFALIESALQRFERAHQLEPDHPQILGAWGDSELFLGAQTDQLTFIQSAKKKIAKSLQLQSDNPDIWYLYGSCLNELGRYFGDESFYHQAIKKFQYGLSLTRRHSLLWYGLSLAHFALGELNEHIPTLEKASLYCTRMMEHGGKVVAQFWNDWGIVLLKLGELTEKRSYVEAAIEKFEQAFKQPIFDLDQAEADLEWAYNYGCAFDLLGDLSNEARHFEKAVQVLSQVLQIDPDYMHARYNLALALSHLGEETGEIEYYQKAIENFRLIVEQDPEDELIQLDYGIALTHLALLIQEAHQTDKSQDYFRLAENHLLQAVYLGHTQAYYQLAAFYSVTGHYVHAMQYLERARAFGTLPPHEDLMHDDWLEGLRQTPAFRQFIHQLPDSQTSKED